MKIVFDARTIRRGMTGVGRYASELLGHLGAACPDDEILCLTLPGEESLRPPGALAAPNVQWMTVRHDTESHPAGDWWEHRRLPRLLESLRADIFHGPAYQIPAFGPVRPARVVTLHDLSVFRFPEAYPWRFRHYLRWAIRRSVAAADRIICDSVHVRDQALDCFRGLGPERVCAVPLAASADFTPVSPDERRALRARYSLPETYLLMVGTFERRKNPQMIPSLLESIERRLNAPPPPLLWSGNPGHGSRDAYKSLAPWRSRGLFELVQGADFERLRALFQCAEALIYPSLDEGFGLPVLEAMACGTPVVASNRSCLPEVVGRGGICLPLEDPDRWAEAICALLKEPGLRAEAATRGHLWAGRFSWRRTAEETAALYRDAIR